MKPHKEVAQQYLSWLIGQGFHVNNMEHQDEQYFFNYNHLCWMLDKIIGDSSMSDIKKNRWLGYVQGCLTKDDQLNVDEERDRTRQIFNGK